MTQTQFVVWADNLDGLLEVIRNIVAHGITDFHTHKQGNLFRIDYVPKGVSGSE